MLEGLIQESVSVVPITNEAEYKSAIAFVEPLLCAEPQAGSPEYTRAMALVDSIDAYETAQGWNLAEPSEAELAEFRHDQMQSRLSVKTIEPESV